jgi:crotonobetainyl-CoA:carnitine CoA-transferase CaiB-like acyl-CoA transferase
VTFADRIAHRDEIDAAISAWTASRDVADAAAELQAAGVSAMPVMGPDDQHADPHLSSRAFIVTLHHPEVGVEHHVGNPIRFSDLPQRTADSAPLLGVHTQHVLESWLGIDETRYRVLAEAKIAW